MPSRHPLLSEFKNIAYTNRHTSFCANRYKMGASFVKNKKRTSVTEKEKVVLRLKHLRDELKQYQQETEFHVKSDRQLAKRSLREGNPEEAKIFLRKKRYREQQLINSQTQLDKIEQLTHELEFVQIENEIFKIGKKNETRNKWKLFLRKNKQRPRRYSHDDIQNPVRDRSKKKEKVLAKTRDGIEKQKKIDELISGPLRGDDDAVDGELEAILNASYQRPDVSHEKFTYFEDKFLEQPHRCAELTRPN